MTPVNFFLWVLLKGIVFKTKPCTADDLKRSIITERMMSSGMLRHVALVRTDVSEELSASFIRVTRIGEAGTMLAVTSNRRMLRRNTKWNFFIVNAVKTSNLTLSQKLQRSLLPF
jgi:hypothetical protein